jgi:hypothetical protein
MSIAAGSLPDPTMTVGVANIAADTVGFAPQGMTHSQRLLEIVEALT